MNNGIMPEALYDADAEKAVLGCCLAQPFDVISGVSNSLCRDDFFVPAHQELFRVLLAMFDEGKGIAIDLVHYRLSEEKIADKIGSPGILAELLISFATHLNVEEYILRVRERSIARSLVESCQAIVQSVQEGYKSIPELLSDAETRICDIGKRGSKSRILTMRECCDKYLVRRESIQIGEVTPRITTGIEAIDCKNGGLPIPGYGIIAGEMASGKSDLMLEITRHHAAVLKRGVGIFSLEMTEEDILERLISEMTNINSRRLVGKIHEREEEVEKWALQELAKWNVHIDPTSGLGPSDIRRGTRRMVDAGCNLIFLDNAQLAKGSNDRQERHLQLTEVSATLASLSKEHGITFVILVQCKQDSMGKYNKDGTRRLLGEYDLADCAAFQRDGRFILVMNSVDGKHPDNQVPIIINIAKYSQGKTGPEPATFNKENHKIW